MNRTSFYVYKALRGKFSEHASDNLSGRIYIASDFFLRLLNFKLSTLFIGGHKVRSKALIKLFEKHHLQSPERLRKRSVSFSKTRAFTWMFDSINCPQMEAGTTSTVVSLTAETSVSKVSW